MAAFLNSLFALIPFALLFPAECTEAYFDPADRSVTKRFRGVFALLVILHHMAQRVSEKGLMMIYTDTGYLAVAMFFFYSGLGFMKKGIRQKENFFRRRLMQIMIPFLLTMLIYWILYAFAGDVKTPASVLREHFNNASGISFLWFVSVYVLWILFLGVCLRFMKQDRQILYAACLFAFLFITLSLLTIPAFFWVYDTVIMIPAGCLWACREEDILRVIRRHYPSVLFLSAFLFSVFSSGRVPMPLRITGYSFSAVLFMIFLNTVLMKCRPCGKAAAFLGRISYEIYLLHGIPVTFLREAIPDEALRTLSVLVISVLSAWIMHAAGEMIRKR